MGITTKDETDLSLIPTYTLEEIDYQLETLSNILLYSKRCDPIKVMCQVDIWLDRRNDLIHGT